MSQSIDSPDHIEQLRIQELHTLKILDTKPEPAFDRITKDTAELLNVPFSIISLVDRHRQWFKSVSGVTIKTTPRHMAFCAHTILSDGVLVVRDALQDARFAANPLVSMWPGIRFYVGAPLITRSGNRLGALCALDRKPRECSEAEQKKLADLAKIVVDEIEQRHEARLEAMA